MKMYAAPAVKGLTTFLLTVGGGSLTSSAATSLQAV